MLMLYENLIHDMKTPLSILINNLDAIQKSRPLSKKLQPRFESIRQCTNQLFKIMNDLSDYNKIHRGAFNKHYKNYDIVKVLSQLVELAQSLGFSQKIQFIFIRPAESKLIAVDKELLERIMLNLFSNAVKFTGTGGTIEVSLREEESRVLISVKNSGKGIPPEMMKKLYSRYEWEYGNGNKRGSGLGLSIVSELVHEMNGGIDVKNYAGGVEFTLWLPVFVIDATAEQFKPYEDYYSDHMVQIELSDQYV